MIEPIVPIRDEPEDAGDRVVPGAKRTLAKSPKGIEPILSGLV
jgi:hypothetical protein